jgi:hypothetical protein
MGEPAVKMGNVAIILLTAKVDQLAAGKEYNAIKKINRTIHEESSSIFGSSRCWKIESMSEECRSELGFCDK